MTSLKSVCALAAAVCFVSFVSGCASVVYTGGSDSGLGSGTENAQELKVLNHIVFMEEENKSLDSYFGALRQYWAEQGFKDKSFDGLAQFNPESGLPPLRGPAPTNPGCDPSAPAPGRCIPDPDIPVTSFHYLSECERGPAAGWDAYHEDWDYSHVFGGRRAKMNGFVMTAANSARSEYPKLPDTDGIRAMGYWDDEDLNYYYGLASNFAISDRWFQPVMAHTQPNREYLIAATSQGYAIGNYIGSSTGGDSDAGGEKNNDKSDYISGVHFLTATTIFQELEDAGITWKIYVYAPSATCPGPPYDPACLVKESYVQFFAWGQTIASKYPQHIAPISEYFTDLQNGTLPQVAQIEAGIVGPDEHPPTNVQDGAYYVSTLINALIKSSSWKDSAFILTYDEAGGYYDHVAPQPEPSPDGIKPIDLRQGEVCTGWTGPSCDFVFTGYRVPVIVISPYARKHYVVHKVADTTAILKLIETRFDLPPLTKRDAAQIDMTEFFNLTDPPWMTPPPLPKQRRDGKCERDLLP